MNKFFIFICLALSTCTSSAPAFAKVFPAVWDGTCTTINIDKYQHQNVAGHEKQKGFIPPEILDTTIDIAECFPPANGMGPK